MRILGLDPGSRVAGWGLIEKTGSKLSYLASGVLRFEACESDFLKRFVYFRKLTLEVIHEYRPDVAVFESLIFKKNPNSLIKLAQSRGAMLASVSELEGIQVHEYSPNLVKSTLTGYGHSDKEGIQKVLGMLLGIKEFSTHDESDALAIAMCHAILGSQAVSSQVASSKGGGRRKSRSLQHSLEHRIKG